MLPHGVLLILCFLFSRCTYQVLGVERTPKLPPDQFRSFLERVYKPSIRRISYGNVGEPLLLTPLIEQGKLEEARRMAKVDPDFLPPNMDSYAGYFTVSQKYNGNLFFWYFPVVGKKVEETPWIIWLQGGPGGSSLYGLFTEIGPILVNDDLSIEEMQYSWGKNHSLLFIDNPVGTGYSFTDFGGYATNQTTIGENLYTALQQFLKLFPELRTAPLTIAGESYAGKHIPSLGIEIHRRRKDSPKINLYGLAIGNGFIDPVSLQRLSYFAREAGLVSDQDADEIKQLESKVVDFINKGMMLEAFASNSDVLMKFMQVTHYINLYNFLQEESSHSGAYNDYIQSDKARRAIHVGNTEYSSISLNVYSALASDFMNSAKSWLEELLDNYRVMLYNGHLDTMVAYHPSVNTYNSLSFSGAEEFKTAERKPWYHNKRLAGYHRSAGNLREVMVRGAGHMVPADQPAAALGLISAFVRGLSLDKDTGPLA